MSYLYKVFLMLFLIIAASTTALACPACNYTTCPSGCSGTCTDWSSTPCYTATDTSCSGSSLLCNYSPQTCYVVDGVSITTEVCPNT